jgi:hypothetical protein
MVERSGNNVAKAHDYSETVYQPDPLMSRNQPKKDAVTTASTML